MKPNNSDKQSPKEAFIYNDIVIVDNIVLF